MNITKVSESLNELNKYIPDDKSIRMILFLWSKFSKKCNELMENIPQECRRFFHYINIDNPSVRKSIINSSNIKISEVPCIIVINTSGIISTYEGDDSKEIIKSIYDLLRQLNKPQSNTTSHQLKTGLTPLSSIIELPFNQNGQENEQIEDTYEPKYDTEIYNKSGSRSKIRRAERPMETDSRISYEDPLETGMSSVRVRPTRGEGHDGLASSSLGSDITSKKKIQPLMDISEAEILDDDLDDMLDEDATVDPIIKGVKNSGTDNVKKVAEEMMKMRDEQVKEEDRSDK